MISTQIRTESGAWVTAFPIAYEGLQRLARQAAQREAIDAIETKMYHGPLVYHPHGVEVEEEGSTEMRLGDILMTNAPNTPVMYLGNVETPDGKVSVFSRPMSAYERDVKHTKRVFLVALDTGRWLRILGFHGEAR